MTRNPNTRVDELHLTSAVPDRGRAGVPSVGSLLAAAFMVVVVFIARHFYQ
ncbi:MULTISPECIES: hypothetical protein [Gordonibacter]|uniref:Uncharacterized protein n=1 Tax=Gordonibacter faecis TaxID=3047475 RepID=A0ABT7DSZ2_9ACTN|nr:MULTISPECIES: hypothetical protein [unclassified Gordonibacter]MDJ1651723.1 hypothetical protein [Gordonibacter sp. KGMB12511]HIW75312.1 hypothetical protein [Candidatus Gordonibacter avicola]